jgi:hypothetical protein
MTMPLLDCRSDRANATSSASQTTFRLAAKQAKISQQQQSKQSKTQFVRLSTVGARHDSAESVARQLTTTALN